MFNLNIPEITKRILHHLNKESPKILAGIGIGGMLTTTALAVIETKDALEKIENAKRTQKKDKLTASETFKVAWKCYIPAITVGVISTSCVIGAFAEDERRNSVLVAAYGMSETALRNYKDKVKEVVGEKKATEIQDSVDKTIIEQHPCKPDIIVQGRGETLCYDNLSGRYFYSDVETLRHAANKLNNQMITSFVPYISLNEFYAEINLHTVEIGDLLGWHMDRGLIELTFSSQLMDGRTPCLVFSFRNLPDYKYSDL